MPACPPRTWTTSRLATSRWGPSRRSNRPRLAREAENLHEHFEGPAGIFEHDAGLPRPEAGIEAVRILAAYARSRSYLWASLRSALSGYPELLAQLPDTPATVHPTSLGVACFAVFQDKARGAAGGVHRAHEVKA